MTRKKGRKIYLDLQIMERCFYSFADCLKENWSKQLSPLTLPSFLISFKLKKKKIRKKKNAKFISQAVIEEIFLMKQETLAIFLLRNFMAMNIASFISLHKIFFLHPNKTSIFSFPLAKGHQLNLWLQLEFLSFQIRVRRVIRNVF